VSTRVINVIVAGLGGQGVIKASDILAETAFAAGLDVKKAEIHGMSQRGGSVSCDVRFGPEVLSPMVPAGEADFVVVLAADEVENNRARLRPGGVLIAPDAVDEKDLPNRRAMNVALLGVLSGHLDLPMELWEQALRAQLPARLFDLNVQAFAVGRKAAAAAEAR
jgi:indolepyruvate ferredoxin oxidoreductase, beta subunit